jgi:WD40 repeat protein
MPPVLTDLLRQCFQMEPEARPRNMQTVATSLQEIYQQVVGGSYPREIPKPAQVLADSLNNRAVSLLDLGKVEEADQLWSEALQADLLHPEATYNRGIVRWRRGKMRHQALVEQLEAVRLSHEEDRIGEYLLGLVHLERGEMEEAIPLLEAAAQHAPEETKVQAMLQIARSGEIASNRSLRAFWGHEKDVTTVCLSEDDYLALSGSKDHTLRLWEVDTGKCLRTFKEDLEDGVIAMVSAAGLVGVESVSLSKDNRLALSCGWDKNLRLWELATGKCLRIFKGHKAGGVYAVCLRDPEKIKHPKPSLIKQCKGE